MKRTKFFILAWLITGGVYEGITLFDDVPNNTISHAVVSWSQEHPWLPLGVMFCVVLTAGHWWLRKEHRWPWQPPVFKEDEES